MLYTIEHETRLHFTQPVSEHHCELRLAPRGTSDQRVREVRIDTDPAADLTSYTDCFGNRVHHFNVLGTHQSLTTRLYAEVETLLENPFDFVPLPPAHERAWTAQALRDEPRLWDYLVHVSPATPDLRRLPSAPAIPAYDDGRPLIENVQRGCAWVRQALRYDADATHVHSSLEEVLVLRAGVCQDFAHLLVALVRAWGFPARYAVGYRDPSDVAEDDPPGPQVTHAWADVLIPGAGWRGFDPTHGLVVNDTYVRMTVGRDYRDAAPQRGSFKGDDEGETPVVSLRVARQQQ
jgi:transglutaminase-like putative cysteine protease